MWNGYQVEGHANLKKHTSYSDSLKVVLRTRGSVLVSSLPWAFLSATIGVVSMLIRKDLFFFNPWWAAAVDHPFALQVFGVMFAFLITNRVAAAISRWWDGMSTVSQMLLKWHDSEVFVLGYLKKDMKLMLLQQARTDLDEGARRYVTGRIKQLCDLRDDLIHWFSLLNAISLSTLKHGEDGCMASITCKVLDCSWLEKGFTKSKGMCKMAKLKKEFTTGLENDQTLGYIGPITPEEQKQLASVDEKPALIVQWITEAMILSDSEALLNIPPPLAGRAHMRMADAMQAYNDAYRLAAVPYPFPLAQMVSVLMHCFVFLMPVVIEKFTQAWILTPALCFLVTLSYWGLNSVAMELENPFGEDINDLPLKELCETYIDKIMESQSTCLSDLADVSTTVHNYSMLYIDGGCLPQAKPAPAILKAAPSTGVKPEGTGVKPEGEKPREKSAEQPQTATTTTCSAPEPPRNASKEKVKEGRATSKERGGDTDPHSLAIATAGAKRRGHSAPHGRYCKHDKKQVAQAAQRQWYDSHNARPPQHQWLIERAARTQPTTLLQAVVVETKPRPEREHLISDWGGPEAAAGPKRHLHKSHGRRQDMPQDQYHGPPLPNTVHAVVPYGPSYGVPSARRCRSHPVTLIRPWSAPQGGVFDPAYGYYEAAYNDMHEFEAVIPEEYDPGPPPHVLTQHEYEGHSVPHHQHHHHLRSEYVPYPPGDELC